MPAEGLHTVGLQSTDTELGPPGGVKKGDPDAWAKVPTHCFLPFTSIPNPDDPTSDLYTVPMFAPECIETILEKSGTDTFALNQANDEELARLRDVYTHYVNTDAQEVEVLTWFKTLISNTPDLYNNNFDHWTTGPWSDNLKIPTGGTPPGSIGGVFGSLGFITNPENIIRMIAIIIGALLMIKGARTISQNG